MVLNNSWNSQDPVQVAKGGTGIATTTAYAPIVGGTIATGAFQAASTGLSTSGYVLTSNGASAVPSFQAIPASVTAASNLTNDYVVRGDGGAKGVQTSTLAITDAGEMTNASQPSFGAWLSSTQSDVTGDLTDYKIPFDNELWDQNSDYNVNGTFTAPVTGKYNFSYCVMFYPVSAGYTTGNLTLTTTLHAWVASMQNPNNCFDSNGALSYWASHQVNMDAGDTAYVNVLIGNSTKTIDVFGMNAPRTWFSGFLVC